MKGIIHALIQLLKVKTILSIMVVGVTCHLAIVEVIDSATFMSMASAIVTYYFNRKDDKKGDE